MTVELSPTDFQRLVAEVSAIVVPEICRRLQRELVPAKRGVWMSVQDVREELRYSTNSAARKWIHRRRLTTIRRGTSLLVARREVEQALIKAAGRRRRENGGA